MKLTTLEIKGFKSFAEKTRIDFEDGITAIVGPNGCGKSNIVDAIRWVLGEQSTRSLRSDKMENVIFNGTQKRKSSNLAEVSLSFDNSKKILPSEFSQITITRKLFRSGESEYRLNDIICRLKDITDLFLDTGIGPDSYSIIELRMVEELISNKEGSRRNLFEEAAGIAKYRLRKKQTHSKLKDTEEDLERVEDILFEISKNLKSLESQAKRTEKYYKLKDQYKSILLEVSVQRIHQKRNQGEESSKTEKKILDDIILFRTQTELEESQLENIKLDLLNQEKNLTIQQNAAHSFSSEIQKKENELKFKNEKIKNLSEKLELLKFDFEKDQEKLVILEKNAISLNSEISPEQNKLIQIELELPIYKNKMEDLRLVLNDKKAKLDRVNLEIKKFKESAYQNEKELDRIRIQKDNLEKELDRNLLESDLGAKDLVNLEGQLKIIYSKFNLDQENLEIKRKKEIDLIESIKFKEDQLDNLRDKISKDSRILDSNQNEYSLIKSLVENLEGFPESIVFLKKKAEWLKNIPLLSDVIFCQEDFRIAIENYLDVFMNYFVVNTREEAKRAIMLLKNSSKGRANFFILEEIESDFIELLSQPYLIPAMSILSYDKKFQPLIQKLLGHVFLSSSEILYDKHLSNNFILLDKEGTFFSAPNQLSGGSIGLFEGKRIGRAKNLEILQKSIEKAKSEIYILEKNKEVIIAQLSNQKTELEGLKLREALTLMAQTESERNNLVNQINLIQKRKVLLIDRKVEINSTLKQFQESELALLPEIEQKKSIITEKELFGMDLQKEMEETINQISQESNRYNSKNIEFHQVKNKINGLEKDISFIQNQIDSIRSKALIQSVQISEWDLELNNQKIEDIKEDFDFKALYDEKNQLEAALNEMEEIYYSFKNRIQEKEKLILEIRRKKDNSEQILFEIKEILTKFNYELQSIGDRVCLELNLTNEEWKSYLEENENQVFLDTLSFKEKEDFIIKIKGQMDSFGAINPLAMEAFVEIQTRFQFIQTQKEDLIKAKESLLETIREIDHTAEQKFMEAFSSIRENFIKVFRTLFNEEDSCDLVLLNPKDPLDSDIEILARPKGKRPLTINQLSGGEKTLTATAILFSLYLLKPAPFCIFDEVDAPLDDTNIEKFNSIIREFSSNSQFIVVSHNKKTISSTDIIYGVTMAEMGISKLVAVDLRSMDSPENLN